MKGLFASQTLAVERCGAGDTMLCMMALSDDAAVRIFAAEPVLPAEMADAVVAALTKLLQQFIREGRCQAAATVVTEGGRWLVVAWEGPPLSGCSHDKIAQVIATYEQRSGCSLLTSPPIAVGQSGAIRLTNRGGLRQWLSAGTCTAETPVWDRQVTTMGAWRSEPRPLASSVLAPMLIPFTVADKS